MDAGVYSAFNVYLVPTTTTFVFEYYNRMFIPREIVWLPL